MDINDQTQDDQTFLDAVGDDEPKAEEAVEAVEAEEEAAEDVADDEEAAEPETDSGDEEEASGPVYVKVTDDDGNEWEVPEPLAAGFMKQKDYTQKTQAVADMRRQAEERQAQIEALAKRTEEDLQIDAELARLEQIEAQYKQINWDRLAQEDLYDAQQKQFGRQQVRERLEELKVMKNAREQERLMESQRETAKRIQEAEEYARVNIPEWDSGKDRDILNFAREIGFDDEALRKNMDAKFMKMLHRAYVGEAAMKRATEKPKPPQKQVQPAAKIGAKSTGTKRIRLADADMASFIAAREKGQGPSMNEL